MHYPSATYRVQLNSSFTFHHLKNLIEYLDMLGVSTIYAAPITKAMQGSTHGYDVTNPHIISAEIGTEQQLSEMAETLHARGMSWIQDIVPNHMAFITDNAWLMDVLERGTYSPYHNYFDINWHHHDTALKGKLMIPVLGEPLQDCIQKGDIKLLLRREELKVAYFERQYPAAITSYALALQKADAAFEQSLDHLIETFAHADLENWQQQKQSFMNALFSNEATIQLLEQGIAQINNDKDLLRQFLAAQNFLLAHWKLSETEIDYRRFFTVNALISLRMEDGNLFNDYHKLFIDLYRKGLIQGLRLDHIDGLYHPQQYVERLRKLFGKECYIIAEKILEYNEDIAKDWNLEGTSGYEFLSFTNQLFTDTKGSKKLLQFYKELVPDMQSYEDVVFNNKLNFLYSQMGGELDNLMQYMRKLQLFENYDEALMKDALGALMAAFPVYRIYPDAFPLNNEALEKVNIAFEKARIKRADLHEQFDLLYSLFITNPDSVNAERNLLFIMRLMQFTGPLAAKGVEDTTFYVYNPLISHNEVGDSPATLGISVDEFHQKMINRQQNNPYSLNATSTHDTKRGEDARIRINVLAELADEWIQLVAKWRKMNKQFVKQIDGKPAPSANDEYFIYQSILGGFAADMQVSETCSYRLNDFLIKALREAKVETTYNRPNDAYEQATLSFTKSILQPQQSFYKSFIPFLEKLIEYSSVYSLAQVLIKITAPGVPDIYQGCELWDLSYVDPDNRRPVDFELRKRLLRELIEKEKIDVQSALDYIEENKREGLQKLYVTYKALNTRKQFNDVFLYGNYLPLETDGAIAFARIHGNKWFIVVVPVHLTSSNLLWKLQLPETAPQKWFSIFSSETFLFDELTTENIFKKFPVTLLESVV